LVIVVPCSSGNANLHPHLQSDDFCAFWGGATARESLKEAAQRRFFILSDGDELAQVCKAPKTKSKASLQNPERICQALVLS